MKHWIGADSGPRSALTWKSFSAGQLLQQQPRKSACERVMKEGLSPRKVRKKQAGRRCAGLHWGFRQLILETRLAGARLH